jgi:hypothetical protein
VNAKRTYFKVQISEGENSSEHKRGQTDNPAGEKDSKGRAPLNFKSFQDQEVQHNPRSHACRRKDQRPNL